MMIVKAFIAAWRNPLFVGPATRANAGLLCLTAPPEFRWCARSRMDDCRRWRRHVSTAGRIRLPGTRLGRPFPSDLSGSCTRARAPSSRTNNKQHQCLPAGLMMHFPLRRVSMHGICGGGGFKRTDPSIRRLGASANTTVTPTLRVFNALQEVLSHKVCQCSPV